MAEHPNVLRVKALFDAFERRDLEAIQQAIAPDAIWHFPGRAGRLAGAHRGRDAILGFLAAVAELTGGSFHIEVEHILADDAYAVVFFRGRGTRAGKSLDNPTCLKVRLCDGRATEIREFVWNLFDVDEFWA